MSVVNQPVDSSTLELNDHVFRNFMEGDYVEISYPNAQTAHTNGVDGVSLNINGRSDADVGVLTVRVLKYSEDDIFLNNQRNQRPSVVFDGSLKTVVQKDGSELVETYDLIAGSYTTQPQGKLNSQDGNHLSEYMIQFRRAIRSM